MGEILTYIFWALVLPASSAVVLPNPLREQIFPRTTTTKSSSCLCIPGDACWPSTQEWIGLNSTIGGRLIPTVPLAHVCHDPTFDAAACTALQAVWTLPQTQ